MLTHAFETWQVLRACFHTDARNQRSRTALERIGRKFEGILRAHRMAADYVPRDSRGIVDSKLLTAKDAKKGREGRLRKRNPSGSPCPTVPPTTREVCSKLRICRIRARDRFVCLTSPGLMCFCIGPGF